MPRNIEKRAWMRGLFFLLFIVALVVAPTALVLAQTTTVADTYSTALDTPITVGAPEGVLANDANITGTPTVALVPASESNGLVTLNPDGSFFFDPTAGFFGNAGFSYTVTDDNGPSAPATVTIRVAYPTAVADAYSNPSNTILIVSDAAVGLLANDLDNGAGALTAQLVPGSVTGGSVSVNADGTFSYVPLLNYSGAATFLYQVTGANGLTSNQATVTIGVAAATATPSLVAENDSYDITANTVFTVSAPGVLVNDTTTSGGTLTAQLVTPATGGSVVLNTDGSFTYTAPTGFSGTVTFQYRAVDGVAQSNTATVTLNIGTSFLTPTSILTQTAAALSPVPTITPTLIPLFIPGATPVPQAVPNAGQTGRLPISDVTVLVNRDGVNVRLIPAIGAEVIGFVNAGFTAQVKAKTADNQWVKVDFSGEEGWIGMAVLTILNGANLDGIPVEDPRTIPYGGFGSPRAGLTSRTSAITGILRDSGVRVRSGPSRAYVVLANAPRYTTFAILGRTINNAWFQVNFNGVLGWVIAREVELQNANYIDAPIDGIVADALPISEATDSNYVGTLRLLRDRLDLAQVSLDTVRQRWTDAALTGQLACGNYPAKPTDYDVANPLAAAYYTTLVPVVTDFNSAMANLGTPIDLLLQACTEFGGRVGQPQIQIALEAIAAADGLFAQVRGRLNQLIPPDRELGPEDCPFTFAGQTDILPRLRQGQLAVIQLTARNFVVGFCVDASAGQQLRVEVLTFSGNARPVVSVSAYDNPSNFIGVGRADTDNDLVSVGPITIDRSAVYLIVISDLGTELSEPLDAQVALMVTDITGATGGLLAPGLSIDPTTGQLIANPNASLNLPTPNPNLVLTPGTLGGGPAGTVPTPIPPNSGS